MKNFIVAVIGFFTFASASAQVILPDGQEAPKTDSAELYAMYQAWFLDSILYNLPCSINEDSVDMARQNPKIWVNAPAFEGNGYWRLYKDNQLIQEGWYQNGKLSCGLGYIYAGGILISVKVYEEDQIAKEVMIPDHF